MSGINCLSVPPSLTSIDQKVNLPPSGCSKVHAATSIHWIEFTLGNIGSMKTTIQKEWAPAAMKVIHFNEALMPWHFKVFRHSGTGRGGGKCRLLLGFYTSAGSKHAGLHQCFGGRTGWRQTQNILALLCLSTSAEEHVQLQDKSFPPPFWPLERESHISASCFLALTFAKLQPSKYFCVFALGLLVIIVHLQLKFSKSEKMTHRLTARCRDVNKNPCSPSHCLPLQTNLPHCVFVGYGL